MAETYKSLYLALPAKARKAIRDVMKAARDSDRRHPVISGTYCMSRFDQAVAAINHATRRILEEKASPEKYVYYEDQHSTRG